jgi:ketosteroid isomerase-like protein
MAMGQAKQAVDTFWELMESGDLDRLPEIWTAETEFHMAGQTMRGFDDVKRLRDQWWGAFPNLHHTTTDYLESGDVYACELVVTGRHDGTMATPMADIPATGRDVEMRSADYIKVHDGKIVRWDAYPDMLGLLGQIGALPEPASA